MVCTIHAVETVGTVEELRAALDKLTGLLDGDTILLTNDPTNNVALVLSLVEIPLSDGSMVHNLMLRLK